MVLSLSGEEFVRYERQINLPNFGEEKQLRLKGSKVLIVGAGGLGCPVGLYLAAAGVGTIGVADFDTVELSNLQRQVAHSTEKVGFLKTESLISTLKSLNPLLTYRSHPVQITAENVLNIIFQYDLIVDGSDNFTSRFLLADACFLQKRPLLHGSIYQFDAQIALFVPDKGPCYRCLYKEPPPKDAIPNCNEAGVLGVLPGTVGLMMATEAIKFLTNLGNPIVGKLLIYNALDQSLRHLQISKDLNCSLCGQSPTILSVQDIDLRCETKFPDEVFPTEAKRLLEEGAYLLDVREPYEFELGHIKGAELIPVGKISDSTTSFLPKDKPILVYCHHGVRSQYAIKTLQQLGFSNAVHLAGGIDAWSTQIDPKIHRY